MTKCNKVCKAKVCAAQNAVLTDDNMPYLVTDAEYFSMFPPHEWVPTNTPGVFEQYDPDPWVGYDYGYWYGFDEMPH